MATTHLDLGCGTRIRNPFDADEVWGVDLRADLGEHVKVADLAKEPIPFPDASFDFVSACDLLQFIPTLLHAPERRDAFARLISEIGRVLKPGGMFLSFTPAILPTYFDDPVRWV